jgi:putative molybdopterin biosynthesis protein
MFVIKGEPTVTELLTVAEVQDRLKIGRRNAYDLIARGKLPSYRIGEKSLRISAEDLDQYIDSHRVTAQTSDSGDSPQS